MEKSSFFSIVKEAYQGLPEDFKKKYRGKFTSILGELKVYEELKNQGYAVPLKSGQASYDLALGKKKVEIKPCNRDNTWIRSKFFGTEFIAGCSGIKPSKFDILIYVEFDDSLSQFEYYVFDNTQAATFPYTYREKTWYAKNYLNSESRTLNNPFSTKTLNIDEAEAERLNRLLKDAKQLGKKFRL